MAIFNLLVITALASLLSLALGMDASSCVPGTFFNGKKCKLCPKGTYQYRKGKTSCTPCPPGTYFPFKGGPGRDVCLPCPAGTFSKATGAKSSKTCKRCRKGLSSAPYSSKCISCPPGTNVDVCAFFQSVVNGVCKDCIKDQCFQNEPKPKCVECPALFFAPKRNSKQCGLCPLNSESPARARKCNKCPRKGCQGCRNYDVYDPSFVDDTVFDIGDIERSSGCRPCPAGQVGNKELGAARCVSCPAGTFKKDDESGPCTPCDSGDCVVCNKQQRYNPNKKICEACPPKQESAGGQATKCTRCPKGSIGTREGCLCQPGWGPNGKGGCRICPPGTQGPDYFFFADCAPCREGSFAPKAGTLFDKCRECPTGKLSSEDRTKCVSCPKGLNKLEQRCVSPITNCAPGEVRENEFIEFGEFEDFFCRG